MKYYKLGLLSVVLLMLAACASMTIDTHSKIQMSANTRLGILPFENNTTVPQAGDRVAAITQGLLLTKGIKHIYLYPRRNQCKNLISCANQMPSSRRIKAWARRHHLNYIVKGTVNEWRYKVGLDGEPAANITLQILAAKSNRVVWSSVGSKTGGSRSGLSTMGQILLNNMFLSIVVQ